MQKRSGPRLKLEAVEGVCERIRSVSGDVTLSGVKMKMSHKEDSAQILEEPTASGQMTSEALKRLERFKVLRCKTGQEEDLWLMDILRF